VAGSCLTGPDWVLASHRCADLALLRRRHLSANLAVVRRSTARFASSAGAERRHEHAVGVLGRPRSPL
jgi:hypothetical protein